MLLRVRATPNARRSEIVGWDRDDRGPILKVRVAAPPAEGKANAELTRFLAATLGVPKSEVRLAKGASSRIKVFGIPDAAALPPQTPPVS